MKNTGTVAGISDLIIWLPNQKAGIIVEVKDYKGKQSPAQIKIQKKLENIGGVYLLVRSLSEFQQQIKKLFMKKLSRLHSIHQQVTLKIQRTAIIVHKIQSDTNI
jgi:hypothetical protein